jgi:hypothetical protein
MGCCDEVIDDKEDENFRPSLWYQICGKSLWPKHQFKRHMSRPESKCYFTMTTREKLNEKRKDNKNINELKVKKIPILE